MKITDVEVAVIHAPTWQSIYRDEAPLVIVHTDEGLIGVGEASGHAFAIKTLLDIGRPHPWERGIKDVLRGEDPSDPRSLWEKMRSATHRSSRVGLGHSAIGAVDTALWDLAGKIHGVPVWQLLGGQQNPTLTPYITIYHPGPNFEEVVARTLADLDRVRDAGYRAVKIEAIRDRNMATDREMVEYVRRAREHVGPDYGLMLDVGSCWKTFEDGYAAAKEIEQYNLLFLEDPFMTDDLPAWRHLGEVLATPIAGGGLTSHGEFVPLIESGGVDIVQPGVHRSGMIDCDRVCKTAQERGLRAVPFAICATTFTVAATIHVAVANANVDFIEYGPPFAARNPVLRAEVGLPEPTVRDGLFALPTAPGLGVELDRDALARYRVA